MKNSSWHDSDLTGEAQHKVVGFIKKVFKQQTLQDRFIMT